MRLELSADVFADAEALPDLLRLLRCVAEGRHDWEADPVVQEAAARYFAHHLPRLAGTYATLGRKGAVAAVWRGVSERTTVVRVCAADLDDHVEDLARPAVVVVENHQSDGSFLRVIARVFRAHRLESALERGWLQIDHGGGDTLASVAEAAAVRFRLRTRVAAMLDSDRWLPGQRTPAHDKADRLSRIGIVVHVLELREAENYVPNRVLQTVGRPGAASRKLDLLKQLTSEQRGHFNMKEGFGPDNRPPAIRPEQRTLYAGVSQRVLNGLREDSDATCSGGWRQ